MLKITFNDANDIVFKLVLEDTIYYIRMLWNKMGAYWSLTVKDYQKSDLCSSIKVVPNYPLLLQHHSTDMPKGELMVVTNSSKIGRDSFTDGSATLMYVEGAEFYGSV